MNLNCQASALEELTRLAARNRHSVLIEGVSGCGKTYLAKQYAKMLHISDVVQVPSTVSDLRKAIDMSFNLESKVVICIENLDNGVPGASYTLLKFLEEPRDNIYVVITCGNMYHVPDTIISRSSVVAVSAPTESDLQTFISSYPEERRKMMQAHQGMCKAARNFLDVDYCMNLSSTSYCDHLAYLVELVKSKKSVSDVVWALGHYPDQTEIPVRFALNYIIANTADAAVRRFGIECVKDLDSSRLAAHTVLAKFAIDCKYSA